MFSDSDWSQVDYMSGRHLHHSDLNKSSTYYKFNNILKFVQTASGIYSNFTCLKASGSENSLAMLKQII